LAAENKNSNGNNITDFSKQSKEYFANSFSYKNQTFSSLKDFQNKIRQFRTDNDYFWQQESENLLWIKKPDKIKSGKGIKSNWFIGSKSNVTINCVDNHLNTENKNKAAVIWESESGKNWILTFQLLYSYMCRTANTIKRLGLKKGNKACIICGSLPETIFAVLACARVGITFTILNPIISPNSLSKRLNVGKFDLIILADAVYRKGNLIEIKSKVDVVLNQLSLSTKKLIFRRVKNYDISVNPEVDFLASDFFEKVSDECKPASLENNFPLFSVFDYDENGNPFEKFFPAAGFMVQTYSSANYAFDFTADDIFCCNCDFSSIAGLVYGIFAPLLHGISTFVYEGLPNFPNQDRLWKLISNYKITKFLSETYIIKAIINSDDIEINSSDLSSLKIFSVTGNPLIEKDYDKIFTKVCKEKIPLTSCFISEETGNIIFADIPGITESKPGYLNPEFPSIEFDVVNSDFQSVKNEDGLLVFKNSCPTINKKYLTQSSTSLNQKKDFISSKYLANQSDNKIKILNRVDNKLEIAGELISLKEVQEVIESHSKVKSCRIDTKSDSILYLVPVAFVEINNPQEGTLLLKEELRNLVEQKISSAAKPIDITFSN
jgi:acetyl-CoA synthetase